MFFEPGDSESKKLSRAREHFIWTRGRLRDRMERIEEDFAYRHGDQWDDAAKRKLAKEGRPALTFNVIAPLVREVTGANEDQRRQARVLPIGPEDLPTSQVINHLWRRIYEVQKLALVESEVFEKGLVGGIGYVFIDARRSTQDPGEMEITVDPISPFEVLPDPEAQQRNFSDAKYFYWSRWVGEGEFKQHYPEHASKWEELRAAFEGGRDISSTEIGQSFLVDRAAEVLRDPRFFKRDRMRLRVIHLEYEAPVKLYFAWNPAPDPRAPQRAIGWEKVKRETYTALKRTGLTPVDSSWGNEWRWFEFTGLQVLYDDVQPLPLRRAQIVPFTAYIDDISKDPYGMVKDLKDPQAESNKRYSQELNLLNQNVQPGAIADKGAFADPTVVERKMREPGFFLEKMPGTQVVFRDMPPLSGVSQLGDRTLKLVEIISGITLDPLQGPQPSNAPVGTALLRFRKGLMSIGTLVQNFHCFQTDVLDIIVAILLEVFPDEQLERMLGESERFEVAEGVVTDLVAAQELAAQGKDASAAQIDIASLRSIRWRIEMETAENNTTHQLLLVQLLTELQAQAQFPVDPEVLIDSLPVAREQRQKLLAFHKRTMEAQAQQQAAEVKAQREAASQQVQSVLMVEHAKTEQRQQQAAQRTQTDTQRNMLTFFSAILNAYLKAKEQDQAEILAKLDSVHDFAQLALQGMEMEQAAAAPPSAA